VTCFDLLLEILMTHFDYVINQGLIAISVHFLAEVLRKLWR